MSSFGKELIAAMKEAAAHAQRKSEAARVHTIDVPEHGRRLDGGVRRLAK